MKVEPRAFSRSSSDTGCSSSSRSAMSTWRVSGSYPATTITCPPEVVPIREIKVGQETHVHVNHHRSPAASISSRAFSALRALLV